MALLQTSVGDVICVLFGCDMPVVLREIDENSYTFIGGCYMHGIMEGGGYEEPGSREIWD
jgi:hypothetical protein